MEIEEYNCAEDNNPKNESGMQKRKQMKIIWTTTKWNGLTREKCT